MAAPSFVSYDASTSSGGTSPVTVPVPSGATVGDVVVAVGSWNDPSGTILTAPDGWDLIVPMNVVGTLRSAVWAKAYQTGDTTYVWDLTTSGYAVVAVALVRGADTVIDNWQVGPTHNRASTGTNVTNVASAMTADFEGGMAFTWSAERTSAGGDTLSVSGSTERLFYHGSGSSIETAAVASTDYSGTSVPAVTFTYPNVQGTNGAAGHVIIPEMTSPPPPTKVVKVTDGEDGLIDGEMWLSDGAGGLAPVHDVLQLPPEHLDYRIADMLAEDSFYWAHRGGSANWLEMTRQAYTNSVWHGAKSLEVSVVRSQDGVWVMHHDDDTGRMTGEGLGNGLVIANTPWETLAEEVQSGNGYSGPIERLADYWALGYHRHLVTIIDNKTYANWGELLDIIEEQFPGGREEAVERVIIKSSTGAGLGHLQAAYERGYTHWGYFYDDTGQANALDPRIAIIGLNWNAIQDHWDYMINTGKPVVAHVLTSPSQASTAAGKGAVGFQCGDVVGIVPRVNLVPL